MNIFTLSLLFCVTVLADDYDGPSRGSGRSNQRGCVFPPALPANVIYRTQGRGRIMRFMCPPGSLLIGKRFSTCLRGRWSSPPPICINKGCPPQTAPQNGRISESYEGAMLTFGCNPGYIQNGNSTIYCSVLQWYGTAPTCTAPTLSPNVSCDFEDPDLCGWSHGITHNFEWKRNKLSTPSGHVGTGPSYDHTLGRGLAGHYMYLEASAPQKLGDVARLFSPVYPTVLSGSCFSFWYHMYGSTIGALRVYLKEEDQVLAELRPKWSQENETGNVWLQGQIEVPQLTTNFQFIIEGVRGTDYMGDIAIDDVSLNPGSCPAQINQSVALQGSCRTLGCQIRGSDPSVCSCYQGCEALGHCCSDYWSMCIRGPTTGDVGTEEPHSQNATTAQSVTFTKGGASISTMVSTKEPSLVTQLPVTSSAISKSTSSGQLYPVSTTSEQISVPKSTPKVEFTHEETGTTAALPVLPKTDCVIDTSNSTGATDQNWVISLSNCSTKSPDDTSNVTNGYKPTEGTILYQTTVAPALTTTSSTSQSFTNSNPTQPTPKNSTPQLTTTVIPTTPSRITKFVVFPKSTRYIQKVTTSIPTTTSYSKSTLRLTTNALPSTPSTTAITRTTASRMDDTTIPALTTKPLAPVTTSSPTAAQTTTPSTTTKSTLPPSTTTRSTTVTTTRRPVIYIIPASNKTAVVGTTQTGINKPATPTFARTTKSSSQYPMSTITTRGATSLSRPKQTTSPPTTTDLASLFPHSSSEEEDTDFDDEISSGQNDQSKTETASSSDPESSARWQEFPRRPHPRSKQSSGLGVSALATACSLAALAFVVSVFAIYYFVSRRRNKIQRSTSTSEMRFITHSEELEFSLADHSDSVKLI